MNSAMDPSSIFQSPAFVVPFVVIGVILAIVVILLICSCVSTGRLRDKMRLLTIPPMHRNRESIRTIGSPESDGRFARQIWCSTCNAYVDHIQEMCPHVRHRYVQSVLTRRLHELLSNDIQRCSSARGQLQNAQQPQPSTTNRTNRTIDLDELLGFNRSSPSLHRVGSFVSNASGTSMPYSSTPERSDRGLDRRRSSFDRLRCLVRTLSTGSTTSATSGIGSMASMEMGQGRVQPRPERRYRQRAEPRRSATFSGPQSGRIVPRITLTTCTPTESMETIDEAPRVHVTRSSLHPGQVWNGPCSNGRTQLRRSASNPVAVTNVRCVHNSSSFRSNVDTGRGTMDPMNSPYYEDRF